MSLPYFPNSVRNCNNLQQKLIKTKRFSGSKARPGLRLDSESSSRVPFPSYAVKSRVNPLNKQMERTKASSTTSSGAESVERTTSISTREGTAKAMVAEQISQAVQSTSNLLHLMHQSSTSQTPLMKLPKNLLAKASTIRNTRQVLGKMPWVVSSLDTHMENGLHSVPHLRTVIQLLANMETGQLNSLSHAHLPQKESELENQPPEMG